MNIEIQDEWYTVEQCRQNPNKLFVYGDNMIRLGKGGQAIIRDEPNAHGIATKRLPSSNTDSFFSDKTDEAYVILNDVLDLLSLSRTEYENFDTIVLPAAGLGTGLSEMPKRSPKLFKWLHETISVLTGVKYTPNI